MKPKAIVLSGKVCAGKSKLAEDLSRDANAEVVLTADLIAQRTEGARHSLARLQREERQLERDTGGRWLADALGAMLVNRPSLERVVVDSARTADQVRFLRQSGYTVVHVHLDVSEGEVLKRLGTSPTAAELEAHRKRCRAWEADDRALAAVADVVIDTDRCSDRDVLARVAARIDERPFIAAPLVDVLVGGQYGSEGKGNIANFLAPEYGVLVRVGGPNAGHKVFRAGQSPYTFRQLPSGALGNPDAKLVLGAGAVISLEVLLREIAELGVPYDKLLIDPQAVIIEKEDIEWEVLNLKGQIGSTAQGIGHATARKILYRDPEKKIVLAGTVPELNRYIGDTIEFFGQCLMRGTKILLEGTQGTSLSLHHGHYPHVTSRATTAAACMAEAGISSRHVRRIAMVCRSYPIRVGDSDTKKTSGFMSKTISFEDIARRSGIDLKELVSTEVGSVSHRPRRVAEFDWAQLRRSLLLNGPTDIVLTFADYFDVKNRKAFRYEQLSDETLRFIEELEKVSGVSVSLISTAFEERNIIDRRMW